MACSRCRRTLTFELECKESVARDALVSMAAATGERSEAALRFLVGFVDFREVRQGAAIGERRRAPWWAMFVGDARKAKLSGVARKGFAEWRGTYACQNSSGFRLLVHAHGGEILAAAEELYAANPRDNPRHAVWHQDLHRAGIGLLKKKSLAEAGDGDAAA